MANEHDRIMKRHELVLKPFHPAVLQPLDEAKPEHTKTPAFGQVDRNQPAVVSNAISGLVSDAQMTRDVLDVSRAAKRLAEAHGGDSREMAVLITNAGLLAHINMDMSMPGPVNGALVGDRSGAVGGTTDDLR